MTRQMVRTDTGEIDPYTEMDRMDEEQILAEIKGASLEKMVFVSGNIKMLSAAGVSEAVRRLNSGGLARIEVTDREPVVIETDDYIEVRVYARDLLNGGGTWGIKRQDKHATRKDGSTYPDTFVLEKALGKAQRNARRSLIPEHWMREMIIAFLDQQRGEQRQEQPRRQMQAPTPKAVYKQPEPDQPKTSNKKKFSVTDWLDWFRASKPDDEPADTEAINEACEAWDNAVNQDASSGEIVYWATDGKGFEDMGRHATSVLFATATKSSFTDGDRQQLMKVASVYAEQVTAGLDAESF